MVGFDTIRFKIENLDRYEGVAHSLQSGSKITVGGMKYTKRESKFGEIKEDKVILAKLSSASYDVNYFIDLGSKSVTFEFSVPKYLYGNNLQNFPKEKGNEYHDLLCFLIDFFNLEFNLSVDLVDIQLLRIDLCMNYRFESEANKEMYKLQVENIFKNHFRDKGTITYSEMNTVMYKTQDYSFKIYDKGVEFLKHDFTKIEKVKGRKKAVELLKEANLIMRCEMTFRKRKMSYDFFNEIKKTSQVSSTFKNEFQKLKKDYQAVNSLVDKFVLRTNNYIFKDKGDISQEFEKLQNQKAIKYKLYSDAPLDILIKSIENLKSKYGKNCKEYKSEDFYHTLIKREYKDRVTKYRKIVSPKKIYLDLTKIDKLWNKRYKPELIQFDETMCFMLLDKFKGIVSDLHSFKSSNLSPLLALHNYRHEIKSENINVGNLKRYLMLRKQFNDKDLVKKGYYNRMAISRLRAKLNLVNEVIQRKNPNSTLSTIKIPEKIEVN